MLSSAAPPSAGHFPSNPLNLSSPLNLKGNPWAQNPSSQPQQYPHQQQFQAQSHSQSSLQQPKPSPLSSADNAPRSTHLNAVQAVHTYYSGSLPSSSSAYYTHTNNSTTTTNTTNSNSTSTSSLGNFSPPQQHPKLRRMPGGANLAEYRQQPPPSLPTSGAAPPPPPTSRHGPRARTTSLSIPKPIKNMSVNGASSPQSARAMSSINAIAAGPGPGPTPADAAGQGRAGFDGPRSPPSMCQFISCFVFYSTCSDLHFNICTIAMSWSIYAHLDIFATHFGVYQSLGRSPALVRHRVLYDSGHPSPPPMPITTSASTPSYREMTCDGTCNCLTRLYFKLN